MKKEKLPSLSEITLNAITYFAKKKPFKLGQKKFKFPLVVGSGNAYNAGQIIFSGQKAVFANESNFREIAKNYRDLIAKKIYENNCDEETLILAEEKVAYLKSKKSLSI